MREAPPVVRSTYEALSESDLRAVADRRADHLGLATSAPLVLPPTSDIAGLILAVAGEIRARDKALFECRSRNRRDDPRAYLGYLDEAVYILPRLQGSLPTGRRGQEFDRRGLVYHRILPVQAAGIDIRLHPMSMVGPGSNGELTELVSALFPQIEPTFVHDEDRSHIHVSALANEEPLERCLVEQLAKLRGPCLTIVWPELSLSPALLTILRQRLASRALDDTAGSFGFIVAGSWHEPEGDTFVNSAQILDESGSTLFSVLKRERYQPEPGMLENIRPGTEVPVLIYGDVLVGFGICKDFCEDRHAIPFYDLDVDLIIVPSLGDEATLRAHEAAAERLSHGFGARSFVVQQNLPGPGGTAAGWGGVVRPSERPRAKAPRASPQNKLVDHTRFSCTLS